MEEKLNDGWKCVGGMCPVNVPKDTKGIIKEIHEEIYDFPKMYDVKLSNFEVCGEERNWTVTTPGEYLKSEEIV